MTVVAGRVGAGELGQILAGDDLAAGRVLTDRQSALVDPSPDGVIADSQQLSRLTDAQVGHRSMVTGCRPAG